MSIFRALPANDGYKDELRDVVNTLRTVTSTLERVSIEHKVLADDQSLLSKKVDNNERDLRQIQQQSSKLDVLISTVDKQATTLEELKTSNNKVEGISHLVKWGGGGILAIIFASYNTLTTKVDTTTAKTENNAQFIEQVRKENLDEQKQLDILANKVAENRESILTKLDKKRDKNE